MAGENRMTSTHSRRYITPVAATMAPVTARCGQRPERDWRASTTVVTVEE